jgi:uncharacterized membrane protein
MGEDGAKSARFLCKTGSWSAKLKAALIWKYDILHLMLLSFSSLALSLLEFSAQFPAFLQPFRILLGALQVLFITGYFLQLLVFPRSENLNSFERIGLSIGLSIALLAPTAVALEFFNLSLRPQVLAFSHHLLTALLAFVAFMRRFTIEEESRAYLSFELGALSLGTHKNRLIAFVFGLIVSAFLVAMAMVVLQGPAKFDTEFYMLGTEGLAEDFPPELHLNELIELTAAVVNTEGQSVTYRIEVLSNDVVLAEIDSFQLENGGSKEIALSFPATTLGNDQLFEIRLFREGNPDPYRQLELWLNVLE